MGAGKPPETSPEPPDSDTDHENRPNFVESVVIKTLREENASLRQLIESLQCQLKALTAQVEKLNEPRKSTKAAKKIRFRPLSPERLNPATEPAPAATETAPTTALSNVSSAPTRVETEPTSCTAAVAPIVVAESSDDSGAEFQTPRKKQRRARAPNIEAPQSPEVAVASGSRHTPEMLAVRPPPIYLENSTHWATILQFLRKNQVAHSTNALRNGKVRIQLTCKVDYDTITSLLDNMKAKFTFFCPREKRLETVTAVAKNVDVRLTDKDIYDELRDQGYPVFNIHRLRNSRTTFQTVFIRVPNNLEGRKLFSVTHLGGMAVKFEHERKSNRVPLCSRCQAFGHTRNYCRMDFLCGKCAQQHATSDCTILDPKDFVCVRCKGNHASYNPHCPKNPNKPKPRNVETQLASPSRPYSHVLANFPAIPNGPTTSGSPAASVQTNRSTPSPVPAVAAPVAATDPLHVILQNLLQQQQVTNTLLAKILGTTPQ
jgi:hypothetical protein